MNDIQGGNKIDTAACWRWAVIYDTIIYNFYSIFSNAGETCLVCIFGTAIKYLVCFVIFMHIHISVLHI